MTNLRYTYAPLDHETKSIRLLCFERRDDSRSLLGCKLETIDIDHCPPFIAVSYTWGDPEPSHDISLDGRLFSVRENLYSALSVFRHSSRAPSRALTIHIDTDKILDSYEAGVISMDFALSELEDLLHGQQIWTAMSRSELKEKARVALRNWVPLGNREEVHADIRSTLRIQKQFDHDFETGYEYVRSSDAGTSKSTARCTYYWIDAICINQYDNSEKGHQVNLMGTIYTQAALVFAWLGPSTPESDRAMQTISAYATTHHLKDLREARDACTHGLIQRSYWQRMWIIQEFTLAEDIVLFCGRQKCRWKDLEAVCQGIQKYGPMYDMMDARLRWRTRNQHYSLHGDAFLSMDRLIHQFQSAKCSDVRDKIYALLSIAKSQQSWSNSEPLYPDYTLSTLQLYYRVLRLVRYSASLADSTSWSSFRQDLRCILEIPLDEAFHRNDFLYCITEQERPLPKPLLLFHTGHRVHLSELFLEKLAVYLKRPLSDKRHDSNQIYNQIVMDFHSFPKAEDPDVWNSFDDLLREALGLEPNTAHQDLPLESWDEMFDFQD